MSPPQIQPSADLPPRGSAACLLPFAVGFAATALIYWPSLTFQFLDTADPIVLLAARDGAPLGPHCRLLVARWNSVLYERSEPSLWAGTRAASCSTHSTPDSPDR